MVVPSRREFLATGLALAAQAIPLHAASRRRVKGVIWLWMEGGMCQSHTWDPKPDYPQGCRVKAIDTSVPGVQLSELLPVCASQMKNLSVIRTLSHGLGHQDVATPLLYTGEFTPAGTEAAPIGTILAHELGTEGFPLPAYVSIGGPQLPESGIFGQHCVPFRLSGRNAPYIPNIRRSVDATRDKERASLLLEQNKEWGASHQQGEVERLESAYVRSESLMNTTLLKAFDALDEPAALRAEYGEGFGQECLIARRLRQAGVPFTEIGLGGWRRHSCASADYRTLAAVLDRGLGTLVKDLGEKGLLQETLVVCATPFGKPPQSRVDFSDHWSKAFSVVLTGGFLAGGCVRGSTGPAGEGGTGAVPVKDFLATIYSACGVDWEKQYLTASGRKRKYTQGGQPLTELF